VISALPPTDSATAVIVAVPLPVAVTRPVSTTATCGSLDDHANSASATACPFPSNASAVSRTVSLSSTVSRAGDTATDRTDCITLTATLPDRVPAASVIVAVPLPLAVTSPDSSTVATGGELLDQLTGAPGITSPYWSSTSAPKSMVAPSDVRSAPYGNTLTFVARGGSSPQADAHAQPASAARTGKTIRWLMATSRQLIPATTCAYRTRRPQLPASGAASLPRHPGLKRIPSAG